MEFGGREGREGGTPLLGERKYPKRRKRRRKGGEKRKQERESPKYTRI